MILSLDFTSETPIYRQIRNGIVHGIATGELRPGEKLPSMRTLADETGVNMMTVNKAYQLLRQEGYLTIDRRSGARVNVDRVTRNREELLLRLRLIASEAKAGGMTREEYLSLCDEAFLETETRI